MIITKKPRSGLITLGLLILAPNTQYAADADSSTLAQTVPFSVGVEAGTTGVGGNASWRFMNHLGVETGFDYLSVGYNGTIKDNNYNANLRLMSEPLNLELYPWKRSSFHVSLGVLFNENRLTGSATSQTGGLSLGGNNYSGSLDLSYKPNIVDPYAGIGGNLYFDHAHHWSLSSALGVAYAGDGHVSLIANTTPAVATSDYQNELSKVKNYGRDLRFWPVLKLGFNYSF